MLVFSLILGVNHDFVGLKGGGGGGGGGGKVMSTRCCMMKNGE